MMNEKIKQVRFSDNIIIILEPDHISEHLKQSRISDFSRRQADMNRMERMLSPILSIEHRKKIFDKLDEIDMMKYT